jgi:hypothetical protein
MLFAWEPKVLGECLGIIYRAIETDLIKRAGLTAANPGLRSLSFCLLQVRHNAQRHETGPMTAPLHIVDWRFRSSHGKNLGHPPDCLVLRGAYPVYSRLHPYYWCPRFA